MTTPAGWYDDGRGSLRWWDGAQWTEHVHTPTTDNAASVGASPESAVSAQPAVPARPVATAAPSAPTQQSDLPWELQATGAPVGGPPAGDPNTGYPYGAYPGFEGAPGGGVFTGSTEPRKSKLWILWVILGVVVIGIILVGIVVIPLLLHLFSAATSGQTGSTDAERAAVSAVQAYDQAWDTTDCEKYTAATTPDFRESIGIADCDAFESASSAFTEQTDDYEITIDAVDSGEGEGDEILVATTETYTAPFDENGEPTDDSTVYTESYIYTLVPSDGGWAIDSADDGQ